MKKLFSSLLLILGFTLAHGQTNPAYNSIRLTGTDSTSFTVVDGTLRYDHTSNHFRGRVSGAWVSLDASSGGAFWPLSGTGMLTGATTITTDAPNHLTYNGTWTTTADQDYANLFGGTFTLRGTASDRFRGYRFAPTIVAGANNQVLEGVTINPTFTPGAFTGLTQNILRLGSSSQAFSFSSDGTLNLGYGGAKIFAQTGNSSAPNIAGGNIQFTAAGTSGTSQSFRFDVGTVTGSGANIPTGMQLQGTIGSASGTAENVALNLVPTIGSNSSSGVSEVIRIYPVHGGSSTYQNYRAIYSGSATGGAAWSPSSGSNSFSFIDADYKIGQSGTANGDVYFIRYRPYSGSSYLGKHISWYNSGGFHQWDNAISPSQITSNQTDYNPSGWNGADILRVNSDASRTINSLVGSYNGRLAIVTNTGSNNITLLDDDGATGTSTYRFETGSSSLTLPPNTSTWAYYDGTTARWRPIGLGGGGGALAGSANELQKNSGGAHTATGLFSSTDGSLTLGSASISGDRTIAASSSTTDSNIILSPQGAGFVSLNNGLLKSGATSLKLKYGSSGFILAGNDLVTPARTLEVASSTSTGSTSGINYELRLNTVKASASAGIGTGIEFKTQTGGSNSEIGATIESVSTDVTATSEDFDLAFRTMGAGTAASEKFRITSDGRLYGTALHNNAGSVSGTTNQYIASGTYTPTITSNSNLDGTTASAGNWMRVGNVVTVSGTMAVDPTSTAVTSLRISLPISSNITSVGNCGGAGAAGSVNESVRIYGDATNDAAEFDFVAVDTGNHTISFSFTYLIQ